MFLKTHIALYFYALRLATTSLNAACTSETKVLPIDFQQSLVAAQSLLERVEEFDGYNLLVLGNIEKDLNELKKQIPMPTIVKKIFTMPVHQLPSLAKQLSQKNESSYVLFDYLLFFISLYSMECLIVEKIELCCTPREEAKPDRYYRKYVGIKNIMPLFFSDKTDKQLTTLYKKVDQAYLDFRKAADLSCNTLHKKISHQDKSYTSGCTFFYNRLAERLGFLAKAKL